MPPKATDSHPTRLLVADDDSRLRRFLELELATAGYSVLTAANGMDALLAIRQEEPELVILDWMMPDLSGVEICNRMRATGVEVPVLMLTGRDAVADRVEALDAGADDYLLKPFSIEELLARIRAISRRSARSQTDDRELLTVEDLELNLSSHEVRRDGKPIHLSLTEFNLLLELMREPGRVKSRHQLLHSIWGEDFVGDSNVLDVYIRYLRRKLEPEGQPTLIKTIRGVGFLIKAAPAKTATS